MMVVTLVLLGLPLIVYFFDVQFQFWTADLFDNPGWNAHIAILFPITWNKKKREWETREFQDITCISPADICLAPAYSTAWHHWTHSAHCNVWSVNSYISVFLTLLKFPDAQSLRDQLDPWVQHRIWQVWDFHLFSTSHIQTMYVKWMYVSRQI